MALNEKQQKFIDVLYSEAEGDPEKAKVLAGYSEQTRTNQILTSLQEELTKHTRTFLATAGQLKAAYAFVNVLGDPTQLGAKEKMQAAKEILDRTGITKSEQVEVKAESPVFILPPKQDED